MRLLIIAIIALWSLSAMAFFTPFSVNGNGSVTPPGNTPTYYLYGF